MQSAENRQWRTLLCRNFFSSENEAYAALQRMWPGEKQSLCKKALETGHREWWRDWSDENGGDNCGSLWKAPKRLWEGITYEENRKKWKVQPAGPRFADQQEAAQCFADKENRTLASLELEKAKPHRYRSEVPIGSLT